jgi:hypothetical protein
MEKTITRKKRNKSNLYGYLFWCNTEDTNGPIWYAIPREEHSLFFNGLDTKGVRSNKNINKLEREIELL